MSASYKELLEQRSALEAQIAEARAREVKDALVRIRAIITEFGLTQADVFPSSRAALVQRGATGAVAPKYRDPETGKTWTGRGLRPNWLKDKNLEDYLIKN
jgi:DNA-binding protein H-NS